MGAMSRCLICCAAKCARRKVTAAQVFITPQFAIQRADILQALNRLSSAVYG